MSYFKHGIDGYTSLLNAPCMYGQEDDFVKVVIESSYFFEIKIVNNHYADLIRDIISGSSSLFTNFKIYHVWGHASDSRYFTSLWNIVIVPVWASDILDRHNPNGSLSKKMISTFKAVCEQLYKPQLKAQWKSLNICPTTSNAADVVPGTYDLNVLTSGNPIGMIKKHTLVLP